MLELADAGSYTVVTVHREGLTELILGDPGTLFAVDAEQLQAAGYAGLLVGQPPAARAWEEPCASSVYLIRDSKGGSVWLESRSVLGPEGELVVNTRVMPLLAPNLLRIARLSMGGGLLGPIAHELNNIAQGVSSAAFLFRDSVAHGDPIDAEDLEQLDQTASDLARLGAELQNFARIGPAASEPLDLAIMLSHTVKLLRAAGRLKTLDLDLQVPEDLPPMHGRKFELDLLLLTLVGNAADAALEAGSRASVAIRVQADGEMLQLEITDSGKGFALQDCQTPFASSKAGHRHAGLGLSAALAIVAARGGHIELIPQATGCLRLVLPLHS